MFGSVSPAAGVEVVAICVSLPKNLREDSPLCFLPAPAWPLCRCGSGCEQDSRLELVTTKNCDLGIFTLALHPGPTCLCKEWLSFKLGLSSPLHMLTLPLRLHLPSLALPWREPLSHGVMLTGCDQGYLLPTPTNHWGGGEL